MWLHRFVLLIILWAGRTSADEIGFKPKGNFQPYEISAVPSFLIIGTSKSGTTDLYEQLADASVNQVAQRTEPPILRGPHKEMDFLALPFGAMELVPGGVRYMEYLKLLGHPCANYTAEFIRDCIVSSAGSFITVDATPTNLYVPIAPVQLSIFSPLSKIIVMLRDPVERVELLFRHAEVDEGLWTNITMDALTDAFFEYILAKPGIPSTLAQIAACSDLACMADGWLRLESINTEGKMEVKLFVSGLYSYSLAMWQEHYAKSGRMMVIDAYAYFKNRYAVIEQVTSFLYGRAPNAAEKALAGIESFWRKDANVVSRAGTSWILSHSQRTKLQKFYDHHVYKHLGGVLRDMRSKGAWIVGFDGEPWTVNPKFVAL